MHTKRLGSPLALWILGKRSFPDRAGTAAQVSPRPWRDSKALCMWHLGTQFSDGLGSAGGMAGPDDPRGFSILDMTKHRSAASQCEIFTHHPQFSSRFQQGLSGERGHSWHRAKPSPCSCLPFSLFRHHPRHMNHLASAKSFPTVLSKSSAGDLFVTACLAASSKSLQKWTGSTSPALQG